MRRALAGRLQCATARLLAHLPDRTKIALSGEPPIVIDGQQLDAQAQLLRSFRRRRGAPALLEPSIAAGRARYRRETRMFRGPLTPVDAVRDFEIATPSGSLRVRHYRPRVRAGASARQPLIVYLHGGGFVIGDLDTHDEPCRILCRDAEMHVLSVDYRLAPEHPFPAAVEDAQAALAWAQEHAGSLGADPARIAIGGDSAGANLAAAISEPIPAAKLLIYPATDMQTPRPSHRLFADGFVLTTRDRDAFFRHYVNGTGVEVNDPRLSPLHRVDLASAPPTLVIVAGFDPLRDEAEAYAEELKKAAAEVRVLRFPSLEHGFIHMTGVCPAARDAMHMIARTWGA